MRNDSPLLFLILSLSFSHPLEILKPTTSTKVPNRPPTSPSHQPSASNNTPSLPTHTASDMCRYVEIGYKACNHILARQISECHNRRADKVSLCENYKNCPYIVELAGKEAGHTWVEGKCYYCEDMEPKAGIGPCKNGPHILKDGKLPPIDYPTFEKKRDMWRPYQLYQD